MSRPRLCNKCRKPKRPKGKKYKDRPHYCACGRPEAIDATKLQKLKDAFMNGMNDSRACAYAKIAVQTLYNYQEKHPEFLEEKKELKLHPELIAQQTVVKSLTDPQYAWRFMERKDPEFKPVTKVEHAGSVEVNTVPIVDMSEEEKAAVRLLTEARRKRIDESAKNFNQKKDEKILEEKSSTTGNDNK